MKFIIYIFSVFLILITTGYSKEVCITNYGKDPVALILSHSMQWVERRRGRCLNTDDTKALIQIVKYRKIALLKKKRQRWT